MSPFRSEFLSICKERGFIHQGTDMDALDQLLHKECITAYLGFDATATSLHVGSLVCIMWLRWLQKTGHKPIVLMGGATSKIGDPTGKDAERKFLSDDDIQTNITGIAQTFGQFLDFNDSPTGAVMVNNADWIAGLNYIDFLRDYGRHFSINRMLTFDSVRLRLEREQSLSFLEFNYMIVQAYDFLELSRHRNCQLQLGGSDQWGNIINGVELVKRADNRQVYGLTTPLITTSSGAKMGKTSSGAVWLNKDLLPSYDYWQFWRNTDDKDVGRYLRLFTEIPMDEIERLEKLEGAELNHAKKILADHATALARGVDDLPAIHETIARLFEGNAGSLDQLPKIVLSMQDLPVFIDDLFVRAGLCNSKGEARRLIQGGGARLDDQPITDVRMLLDSVWFQNASQVKISAGRKKHVVICVE
ncbi:MAG: tyrosine--tRNA ligase [Alphaproteobacteria bacterium]|nr:tyrosine--tRNA ligase [Alphaproteobacteria bacterium]